jgi:hypothetical protein
MQERRQARRTGVRKSAQLIFEPDHSVLDCVVRDLSSAGAPSYKYPVQQGFKNIRRRSKAASLCHDLSPALTPKHRSDAV